MLTAKLSIQNKVYHLQSLITDQKEISPGYFCLSLSAPEISGTVQAGQFIHIFCGEGTYLRRPFSIAGIKKNQIEIIYRVVGEGTEILSRKKKGDILDVLGPLGNGYQITNYRLPITDKIVLIAGGTGIASLLFLAQKLHCSIAPLPITVLLGAKTKNDLLGVSSFEKLGCQVKLATEDGSLGFRGLVTDLFRNSLITHNSRLRQGFGGQASLITNVFTCGPYPMLKKIAKICENKAIKCQVSLEAMMACGIGACRGCVVKTRMTTDKRQARITADKFKYKTVCKDGPVFDAKEILWE